MRALRPAVASLLVLASCAWPPEVPAEPDEHEPPVVLASGAPRDEVRRALGLVRLTRYQHRTEVDEARGDFRLDCSGFVS